MTEIDTSELANRFAREKTAPAAQAKPRPREPGYVRMGHLTVTIDSEDREALRRICDRDGTTASALIQAYVREIIERPENAEFLRKYEKISRDSRRSRRDFSTGQGARARD